jgi:hypothetical protein
MNPVPPPEVGKAYRGADGVLRWVYHRSTRGFFHIRWKDEESGRWNSGGIVSRANWCGGEVSPAPLPGSAVTLVGATGLAESYQVPAPEAPSSG